MKEDFIWLLPTLEFTEEDGCFFIYTDKEKFKFPGEAKPIFDFLLTIDGNRPEEVLLQSDFYCVIEPFLKKMDWIVRLKNPLSDTIKNYEMQTRQLSYYSHLCRSYPDMILEKLKSKKVAVIGLGGIGSLVSHNLLGSGIGYIHIFDFDIVEKSNFNRQFLYNQKDLGKPKNSQCATFLREKFPSAKIYDSQINFDVDFTSLDDFNLIVISGECDGFYKNPELLDQKNVIRSGYFGAVGIVGPLFKAESKKSWSQSVNGLSDDEKFVTKRKCVNAWNSSGASINTTLAGLLSEECVKFLAPELGEPTTIEKEMRIAMKDFSISYKSIWGS